jgi:hypothetical protein
MNRLFGEKRENQKAMINFDEPDQDPENYLTQPMVEDWFVERLLDAKYPPNQVLLSWQKCERSLTQVSQTKLLHKILGQINDMNSPRRFVKIYRKLLETRKLSAAKMEEIYYQGVAQWGHIVIQTGLRSMISQTQWKALAPEGGNRVPHDIRAPIDAGEYSVPINTW